MLGRPCAAVVLVAAAHRLAADREGPPGGRAVLDRRRPAPSVAELEAAREAKYREIRDAELDHQTGKLSDADFEAIDERAACRGARDPAAPSIAPESSEPSGRAARATIARDDTVLDFVQVFCRVVLIFLILMHSGKDAGLSGRVRRRHRRRPARRRIAGRDEPQPLDGRFAIAVRDQHDRADQSRLSPFSAGPLSQRQDPRPGAADRAG